ncbi:TPA: DUF4145 domain-containing protein [Pseudomonas putida]|nr:DUF4145 domain-containing protein [Pseudomonas putida]PKF27398.1 DUF4145 domain-containing protein [Pseudomonas hunanensis]UWH23087.1 DUF4145 domain-containing protein [Pseudomonas sp. HD6515]HDS0942827.1 DUF4145 domain-containing protein [Pseudomonas putida]
MRQEESIHLERCPHCSVAKPNLLSAGRFQTQNASGRVRRSWACYYCKTCGGALMTAAYPDGSQYPEIHDLWPTQASVDAAVPGRARHYLEQAISSIHAPSGAVMLAASAVDAMLKDKGFKQGTLHGRINDAAKQHLITEEMAAWAHEVRLDANDERHADEEADLPSTDDAERVIEFVLALAQFLYVLPSRVERGRRK